jgi:hypothetical protein
MTHVALVAVDATPTALVHAFHPILTAALGTVLLRERFASWQWLGVALGFVGVVLGVPLSLGSGNLQFDVWRQTTRPNHFTVVESWANRGAFDVHEMQKETREFRMKLGPMSGALYDERLYKVLK